MMNFGNPFAGKEALVNALRGGPPPVGGGMVERTPLRRGDGPRQAVPDYSQSMGALGDAMRDKRRRDALQREKNLSQGLTPSGEYMGDVNTGGMAEIMA